MKKRLVAAGFLVIISGAVVYFIGRRSSDSAESAKVDALFAEWNAPDSPGCALGVSRGGEIVYERGYGMANLELGVPITPASVFPAASISKQFTAMSILLLAERGLLSIDDEVRKHIAELPDYGTPITIRHLLTHTSGLREAFSLDGWSASRNDGSDLNEALVPILARQRGVNFAPGAQFQYNNGGYNLLATIVKRVSGQPLRAFADDTIFKPLAMASTLFHDDPAMIIPNRVSSYWRDARGLHVGGEVPGIIGNAGVYSTVGDLLRWAHNFVDVRVGTPALVAAMQSPVRLTSGDAGPYGLGLFLGEYRGTRTIEHGGGDRGISTFAVRYPEQGLAIALLCNSDSIPAPLLAQRIADLHLSDALAPAAAPTEVATTQQVSLSAEQLASKAGWYRDPTSGGLLRVALREGKLTVNDVEGDSIDFELAPVSPNEFLLLFGGSAAQRVEFMPASAGTAQGMRVLPLSGDGDSKGQMFAQLSPIVRSSVELQAFAGDYRSDELDVLYTLEARDGRLVIHTLGKGQMTIEPVAADTFGGNIAGTVVFSRDSRGNVNGFAMNRTASRGIRFDRVN